MIKNSLNQIFLKYEGVVKKYPAFSLFQHYVRCSIINWNLFHFWEDLETIAAFTKDVKDFEIKPESDITGTALYDASEIENTFF